MQRDTEIFGLIKEELDRQRRGLELAGNAGYG
jgi:hypothetical protein